jgi:hypothetical protein
MSDLVPVLEAFPCTDLLEPLEERWFKSGVELRADRLRKMGKIDFRGLNRTRLGAKGDEAGSIGVNDASERVYLGKPAQTRLE